MPATHKPLIDIRPDHWAIVRDILQKHVPQFEVWAFGSRAQWTAKEYSDLDLAIITDKPLSLDISASLSDDFSESDLPWKVDVVDWATTSESFRKIIERDRVVVQEGKGLGMAGEWKETILADVSSDVSYGYTESASAEKVGPRFLRITDIQNGVVNWANVPYCPISEENHRKYLLQAGDIVVARTGNSTGENFLYRGNEDVVYASYLIRFRIDDKQADPTFIWYNLRSYEWWSFINNSKTGSAQAGANAKILGLFPIKLPPLAEQKAIAAVLGALDDKIELNRRTNEALEAMARALFQSWFVDFDPVRAKLDGRQPAGLDAETAALFPAHFQDSPLGSIPQGWGVKPLSEITTLITKGTTPTQDEMARAPDTDAKVNYVRANSIEEDGSIIFDKLTKIPLSVHVRFLKRSILQANDVLYTIAGTIGRIATAEDWVLPANTNQAVAIIRPKPTIPSSFLVLTMRHDVFREDLHNNIVHAVQANLSLGMLSKARAVVPPDDVLLKVFKPIADIMSQISANRSQSRTLATLRDTLLPKLLSGEITTIGRIQ